MTHLPVGPHSGAADAALRRAVVAAVTAPSVHNTQPWRFVLTDEALELHLDRTRRLAHLDPTGRLQTVSCGAALQQAVLTLRAERWAVDVRILPDPEAPDHLASVRLHPGGPSDPDEARLVAAIPHRRSSRHAFAATPPPAHLLEVLAADAQTDGQWLRAVREPDGRQVLAALLDHADWLQRADPGYRAELSGWLRADGSRGDGIVEADLPTSFQHGDLRLREYDLDSPVGAAAGDRAADAATKAVAAAAAADPAGAGTVLVLGGSGDDTRAWLAAGATLARVLLRLTAEGWSASVLGQLIDRAGPRALLHDRLGLPGPVQMVLRVGVGPAVPTSPRRPLEDVLLAHDGTGGPR